MLQWTPQTPTHVTVVSDVLGRSMWNVEFGGKASVMVGGGLPLRDLEMDCRCIDYCVPGGWFFSSGSGKLAVLAM
jgi:hypothetical protein